MKHEVLIMGAGLTGLTIAYLLHKRGVKATIIESRERLGGRIHTISTENNTNLELGATWFSKEHTNLRWLLDELGINYFEQYQKGESALVYNTMISPHHFEVNPNEAPSFRIENGSNSIIDALSRSIFGSIILKESIVEIQDKGNSIELRSNKGATYYGDKVISTLPPKLLTSQVKFIPELSEELKKTMASTHTWMSNSSKFVLTYKTPFWREMGKSGMIISQIGAATEVYDHTNYQENQFALMGFINQTLSKHAKDDRKLKIISYLSKYLSVEAENYLCYEEKDWSLDIHTTPQKEGEGFSFNAPYGDPIFQNILMNNKLYLAGTETSNRFGGYMEGAVSSAMRISEVL